MLEELLRWTIRAEDPLPRAKHIPKTAPHGWYCRDESAGDESGAAGTSLPAA